MLSVLQCITQFKQKGRCKMIEKSILTPHETAEYLGIGMSKCYELLRSKNFPVLTLGKLKRVSKIAFIKLLF